MAGNGVHIRMGFWLLAWGIAAVAVVLCALSFNFWLFLRAPGGPGREKQVLDIEAGSDAAAVSRSLEARGVVSDARKFYLLCLLRRASHKLKAGEYAFLPLSSPDQVLDQLVKGKVLLHRVTFPEGSTIRDVARIVGRSGLASDKDILRLAADSEYVRSLGLSVPSLEGYLFPETYFFRKPQSPASILKALVRQFRTHFPAGWQRRAEELGLSVHQVVILASIVEKEAAVDSERPLIAAVFLNRLKHNMPLQSDPTAVYDLPDFTGPITAVQLKRESPYNTYAVKGLPIGPICNPGARSLEAALYPGHVSYLYFVSNSDGTHHFSDTLAEHNQAVSRYRKAHSLAPPGAESPASGEEGGEGTGD